jgi:hypothetical protein
VGDYRAALDVVAALLGLGALAPPAHLTAARCSALCILNLVWRRAACQRIDVYGSRPRLPHPFGPRTGSSPYFSIISGFTPTCPATSPHPTSRLASPPDKPPVPWGFTRVHGRVRLRDGARGGVGGTMGAVFRALARSSRFFSAVASKT